MLSGSDEPAARPDRAARPPPTPPTACSEGVHRQGPGGRPAGSWVGPLRSRSVRAFGGWRHAAGRKPLSQSYTSWCSQPTARDRSLKGAITRKKARSRARSSLTWGFAAPQIPPYPLNTPPRSTPSGYCSTRKVRARVVRQTRVVLLVSHLGGFHSDRIPVLGCCSPPIGEPRYLVGERSGPDRATNRASVWDLGS